MTASCKTEAGGNDETRENREIKKASRLSVVRRDDACKGAAGAWARGAAPRGHVNH